MWTLADAIDRRYRPVILIGAYGGLRPGETLGSVGRPESSEAGGEGNQDEGVAAHIKLPAFMVDEFARHRHTYPHVSHIVFASTGNPVDGRMFRRRAFATAVRRSVGEPTVVNDLRHTHIALLIAGVGIRKRSRSARPHVYQDDDGHLR